MADGSTLLLNLCEKSLKVQEGNHYADNLNHNSRGHIFCKIIVLCDPHFFLNNSKKLSCVEFNYINLLFFYNEPVWCSLIVVHS